MGKPPFAHERACSTDIPFPSIHLPVFLGDSGLALQLVGNDFVAVLSVLAEDVIREGRGDEQRCL